MIKSTVSVLHDLKQKGVEFRWFRSSDGQRLLARLSDNSYMIGTPYSKQMMIVRVFKYNGVLSVKK